MAKQQTLAMFFGGGKGGEPLPKKQRMAVGGDAGGVAGGVVDASVLDAQPVAKAETPTETKPVAAAPVVASGGTIPYASLCSVFASIEAESSRLKIISLCSSFFQSILSSQPSQLVPVTFLFINRLGPDYEPGLELGLGELLITKAIAETYGRPAAKIKADLHENGDLGKVAEKLRVAQPPMFKPAPLDVPTVFSNLQKIATASGNKLQTTKVLIIGRMLAAASAVEARYLVRLLEGKLRIGLAEKTVLLGLAQAFVVHEDSVKVASGEKKPATTAQIEALTSTAEELIRDAFCQVPNYERVINAALEHGIMNLAQHCVMEPGIPLKPMLAKPTKSVLEVLDRFEGQEFTCEYKYDGERAQVHLLPDGLVRVYSRNSEDMLQRYPDIVEAVQTEFKVTREDGTSLSLIILDCEAVAWDRASLKILPFQVLLTRKRKDVEAKDIKVHVCLFAFDMLYLNGEPLLTTPLGERRARMHEVLTEVPGRFQYATAMETLLVEEIQQFLDELVQHSCEGLMVKLTHGSESGYEPSKRLRNWLKLKKDYLDGVGDLLDLVVVGAYIGKGKRTGAYGGFLLATYNPDSGDYETACKIGTGFLDEALALLYQKLLATVIEAPKPYYVHAAGSSAAPDVWFEPTTVFEVLTADLSLLPVYKAGESVKGKGILLRFPRMMRVRDDKGPEDATTSDQIVEMYERQASVQ